MFFFLFPQAVAQYTRQAPDARVQSLIKFSKRIRDCPDVQEEMKSWNLKISQDLERVPGRTFKPETILIGNNRTASYNVDNADWSSCFR